MTSCHSIIIIWKINVCKSILMFNPYSYIYPLYLPTYSGSRLSVFTYQISNCVAFQNFSLYTLTIFFAIIIRQCLYMYIAIYSIFIYIPLLSTYSGGRLSVFIYQISNCIAFQNFGFFICKNEKK